MGVVYVKIRKVTYTFIIYKYEMLLASSKQIDRADRHTSESLQGTSRFRTWRSPILALAWWTVVCRSLRRASVGFGLTSFLNSLGASISRSIVSSSSVEIKLFRKVSVHILAEDRSQLFWSIICLLIKYRWKIVFLYL